MSLLAWAIDPLPDFLTDHTLTGQNPAERLREYAARWVQFAGSMWEWHDRATFAVRFVARQGKIGVFLMARAHDTAERDRLRKEVGVILRAHRLFEGKMGRPLSEDDFDERTRLSNPVIAEVRQLERRGLWEASPKTVSALKTDAKWYGIDDNDRSKPPVVFPWWGPGGPFLLPMESLISQSMACSLTAYVSPTLLNPIEREWLDLMVRDSATKAEQNRQIIGTAAPTREVDPVARLAGRLYMANLRRLSATPFLVAVHCAAECVSSYHDARDVALSIAGTVQSLVHEPSFERPQQEDDRLPSGASVSVSGETDMSDPQRVLRLRQYNELLFESSMQKPLDRISRLADPQGAATVFRLPVSVRGGVPGVQVRQLSPTFHPGPRQDSCPQDHIDLGFYHSSGRACVPIRELTKHVLITGFTGSGKTVTVLNILHQLWYNRIPFLVLESAKQEYRGFLGVPSLRKDLLIFTLGNETCVPFRLNPFQLLPGVRVEAHLGKLQSCFEGAIPPIGPSSSIINEALEAVYKQHGWSVTDSFPADGQTFKTFPTLGEFVNTIEKTIANRGYSGELLDNLTAALVGRMSPLLRGSKGLMFESRKSFPDPEVLFSRPIILEMNDLVLDDKALVSMFVLTLLREYRELHRAADGSLLHVTMVEEAHNILEEVGSFGSGDGATQADTRHKAVQAFCSLLTEIRSLGEGLIIADQSPVKLARDAMRNTNLQIAHQLRDGQDRNAVANAMIMENEQRDFLGKLPPGNAALFRTGLEKATFAKMHQYYPDPSTPLPRESDSGAWDELRRQFPGAGFRLLVSDHDVRQHMDLALPEVASVRRVLRAYPGCDFCPRRQDCPHQERSIQIISQPGTAFDQFEKWWSFRGSIHCPSLLSVTDLIDIQALVTRLLQGSRAFDDWLVAQLSPATRAALVSFQGCDSDPASLQRCLLEDLNRIIDGDSIYQQQRFDGIKLSQDTRDRLSENPHGVGLRGLNRRLIEDAFPRELSMHKPTLEDWRAVWQGAGKVAKTVCEEAGAINPSQSQSWCLFIHLWNNYIIKNDKRDIDQLHQDNLDEFLIGVDSNVV